MQEDDIGNIESETIPSVVFDCNLFLQAVGKGGNHAYRCLQLAMEGKITLCMSEAVLTEIDEVLRRPIIRNFFPMLNEERVDNLTQWIRAHANFLDPIEHRFDYPVDPKDEPYIDLAIAAGAVFLVSWDKHIKRLATDDNGAGKQFMKSFPSVYVMDPKEFLAKYFGDS